MIRSLFIVVVSILFGCSDSSSERVEENADSFSVSKSKIEIDDDGGIVTIAITTPKDQKWTILDIPEWCTFDKVSSKWNEEIKITISPNKTCLTRIAAIQCRRGLVGMESSSVDNLLSIHQEGKVLTIESPKSGILHKILEDKLDSLGMQRKDIFFVQKIAIVGKIEYQDIKNLKGLPISYIDISNAQIEEGKREIFGGKFIISPENTIDNELFDGFVLKKIILPNIIGIGKGSFGNCTSLETIKIPNSVTYIGDGAFRYSGIKSIELPNNITSIEMNTFESCKSLENIIISESVVDIGRHAFRGCTSLETIKIPNSVTYIGYGAFRYSGIKSIELPNNITSIRENTFWGCTSLETIKIPNSVTYIGDDAFRYSGIKSIELPNNITSIRGNTFWGCTSLENIIIPESVVDIWTNAFRDCIKMKEVVIPSQVIRIGSDAFSGVPLSSIHLKSTTPPTVNTSVIYGSFDDKYIGVCKLYVPKGLLSKYRSIGYWNRFGYIIEE